MGGMATNSAHSPWAKKEICKWHLGEKTADMGRERRLGEKTPGVGREGQGQPESQNVL